MLVSGMSAATSDGPTSAQSLSLLLEAAFHLQACPTYVVARPGVGQIPSTYRLILVLRHNLCRPLDIGFHHTEKLLPRLYMYRHKIYNIYTQVYMYEYLYMYIRTQIYIYIEINIYNTSEAICIHTYMHKYLCIYIYFLFIYLHVYMHVYTYIYI